MSSHQERSTRPAAARPWALSTAAALVLAIVGAKASARWLSGAPEGEAPASTEAHTPAPSAAARDEDPDKLEAFVLNLVTDADRIWAADFRRRGKAYTAALPLLLDAAKKGECGPGIELGRSECYGSEQAIIDLSFQRALGLELGPDAAGARAYAIAHEMGHHVQRVLGMDRKLDEALAERKVASHWVEVQLELQADCLAGVWARRTRQAPWTEPSQIEAALRNVSELGTKRRLEAERHSTIAGETFTYAIPRRRIYWFAQGYAKAEIEDCDTFAP